MVWVNEFWDMKEALVAWLSLRFSISKLSSLIYCLWLSSYFCFMVSCLLMSPSLFSASCTASSYFVHFCLVFVRSSLKTFTTLFSSSTTANSFFIDFNSSCFAWVSIFSSSYCYAVSCSPVITFWNLSLWAVTLYNLTPFSCSISNYSSSLYTVSPNTICLVLAYSTSVLICSSFIFISLCNCLFFSLLIFSIIWLSASSWLILSMLSAFSISRSWYFFRSSYLRISSSFILFM